MGVHDGISVAVTGDIAGERGDFHLFTGSFGAVPHLSISRRYAIEFVDRSNDSLPRIEALNITLVHQLVRSLPSLSCF
jgi:hypothetical protein